MGKLKFLLLNQTFFPDVASTAQHLADLAAALAERGHQVTVVAGSRAYGDPKKVFARQETWRGVEIRRVPSTGFGKAAKWRRVLDCASFLGLCLTRLPWTTRQDVVLALTSPPLIALAGLLLAILHRSRFVYWVMDLNPDEAIAIGWIAPGSLLGCALECLSRLSLRRAYQVIALDRAMFKRILAKGVPAGRISVLPPWSHDSEAYFDARGRERFRRQHGLEGKFVVMYSGNHSPCHPLGTLLEAVRRLATDPDFTFCFVGGGTEFGKIQTQFAADGPKPSGNVICLPYQPLSGLAASLSAADVHIIVMGDDLVGLVHPCKVYNLLRVGLPMLYIGPFSPVSQVVAEAPRSACLAHGDVEGLLRHLVRLRAGSSQESCATSAPWVDRFSKQAVLPQFIKLLELPRNSPATSR